MAAIIKRFYSQAGTAPHAAGHAVTVDGKGVRTPLGHPLATPSAPLARAVAEEWQAQGATIDPASMPLTQLLATALDRVGPRRDDITEQLIGYAGTDLVCYHSDDPVVGDKQRRAWQPVLDWLLLCFDARLEVTTGLLPIAQPAPSLAALGRVVAATDDLTLTALQAATAACGSLVLALALVEGHLTGEQAWAASQVDETHQAERWGEEAESVARRAALRADVLAAERFLTLARAGNSG